MSKVKNGFSTGKGFLNKVDNAICDENGLNINSNYLRTVALATPDNAYKNFVNNTAIIYALNGLEHIHDLVVVTGLIKCANPQHVCFVFEANTNATVRQLFYFTEVKGGEANTPYGFVNLEMYLGGSELRVSAYKVTVGSITTTTATECQFKLLGCYEIKNSKK